MIRKATASDIPYILDLYKKGLKEIGADGKESLLLNKIVTSYHLAPCFLLEVGGEVVGMAGFTIVTQSHDGSTRLADYMFYVEPQHRSIKTLGRLVEAAKAFSKEHDLPLRLEFISRNDEELRRRVLKMHGFEVVCVIGEYNGR
tara:strand:- start:654 stop:1085 length:432 start_codon:yes stop_codon:yes gene_type:complete